MLVDNGDVDLYEDVGESAIEDVSMLLLSGLMLSASEVSWSVMYQVKVYKSIK